MKDYPLKDVVDKAKRQLVKQGMDITGYLYILNVYTDKLERLKLEYPDYFEEIQSLLPFYKVSDDVFIVENNMCMVGENDSVMCIPQPPKPLRIRYCM